MPSFQLFFIFPRNCVLFFHKVYEPMPCMHMVFFKLYFTILTQIKTILIIIIRIIRISNVNNQESLIKSVNQR